MQISAKVIEMISIDKQIELVINCLYHYGISAEEIRRFILNDGAKNWEFPKVKALYLEFKKLQMIHQKFEQGLEKADIVNTQTYRHQEQIVIDLYRALNPMTELRSITELNHSKEEILGDTYER